MRVFGLGTEQLAFAGVCDRMLGGYLDWGRSNWRLLVFVTGCCEGIWTEDGAIGVCWCL